jgi:aminomethyltransferase
MRHSEQAFTDFGGWEMPVRYSSDLAEHHAVRNAAGLFDISHMGEIFVEGKQASELLDFALVGAASEIAIGRAKYSLICNEDGGIIDDLIVYRLGQNAFLVVANASNREAVVAAMQKRRSGFDAEVKDESDAWVLLAIQGPNSVSILSTLTSDPLDDLKYYAISESEISGVKCLLARTGYTGEDGFEIYIPVESAGQVFDELSLCRICTRNAPNRASLSRHLEVGSRNAALRSRDESRCQSLPGRIWQSCQAG